MKENKYIGDDKFIKMLEHYDCPTPLAIVKIRFAGAVCSPNLELRPADVISSFWDEGKAPRLETKEEADLFFKFFMGLWDEVFAAVRRNDVRLSAYARSAELPDVCALRYAEVEYGFLEGFFGGKADLKIPAFLGEVLNSLSDLANVYDTLAKKLDNPENSAEVLKSLSSTDKLVEKAIAFIIESSVLPRIESLQRTVN